MGIHRLDLTKLQLSHVLAREPRPPGAARRRGAPDSARGKCGAAADFCGCRAAPGLPARRGAATESAAGPASTRCASVRSAMWRVNPAITPSGSLSRSQRDTWTMNRSPGMGGSSRVPWPPVDRPRVSSPRTNVRARDLRPPGFGPRPDRGSAGRMILVLGRERIDRWTEDGDRRRRVRAQANCVHEKTYRRRCAGSAEDAQASSARNSDGRYLRGSQIAAFRSRSSIHGAHRFRCSSGEITVSKR